MKWPGSDEEVMGMSKDSNDREGETDRRGQSGRDRSEQKQGE